ncbi:uncharacterized protein LOC116375731 [Oncorhynchus kisutch]|uniref:uncharacterized protein LOC116375731 n=1 Tax=Oncorhynchus kisutch TaxID=8019 RepID=UPI0012DD9A2A|nr:uncharacterized protein LOC116375731 [Oncorhynchus kisutch]
MDSCYACLLCSQSPALFANAWEPTVCPVSEPSVSQELSEPSVIQEMPEPSASQELPEPSASQELPEPSASQELPEPPVHSGPVVWVSSPKSVARIAALKRPRWRAKRRTKTMVKWSPRPAPEPPPRTDAHPDPPL